MEAACFPGGKEPAVHPIDNPHGTAHNISVLGEIPNINLSRLALIARALADETRVRILLALRGQELCACQITELFPLAPSTMSGHLNLLKQAGLVESRKEGRWVYYALPRRPAAKAIQEIIGWVHQNLARDPSTTKDARHLKQILQRPPEELCKKQGCNALSTGLALSLVSKTKRRRDNPGIPRRA